MGCIRNEETTKEPVVKLRILEEGTSLWNWLRDSGIDYSIMYQVVFNMIEPETAGDVVVFTGEELITVAEYKDSEGWTVVV